MKLPYLVKARVALAATLLASRALATSLDDLPSWAGTGTNRAALVIDWSGPEIRNNTTVPIPVVSQSLVWGFRWNGSANAEDMFNAILAADPRLFAVVNSTNAYGKAVLGLGFDLNENRVLGLRQGTNLAASASLTRGLVVTSYGTADSFQSLDPVDLYWGGWIGPGWESWREQGGAGGFNQDPGRGASRYWTPDDPENPYSGNHGQWVLSSTGMNGQDLKDGSWVGWTVAAGGLEFLHPEAPGTIAWGDHKHAPPDPTPVPSLTTPFAATVVSARGPFGAAPYDDPASVLGAPATDFYDAFGGLSGGSLARRVKLVEAAYNLDPAQTQKLITTLEDQSSILVAFDRPVRDDPANPYGVDLLVFGNSFYLSNGFADDQADMNTLMLARGTFFEPLKVSVSPGYTGRPGEDPNDEKTWLWHRYDGGPFGDTAFPTQGYSWDRAHTNWTTRPMDFTKPVNPELNARLEAGGLSAADAIDLYQGSGGGTGFDLAASGFSSVRYLKVEGISPDWVGGEIDAFAAVRPMVLGESLSIAPENLVRGPSTLFFQQPGHPAEGVLAVSFQAVSEAARIDTARLDPPGNLPPQFGTVLLAIQLGATPILGGNALTLTSSLELFPGSSYGGTGNDLELLQGDGTNWTSRTFTFDPSRRSVVVQGVTHLDAFVLAQVAGPRLSILRQAGTVRLQFKPLPHWSHTLERSAGFAEWLPLNTITPDSAEVLTLEDPAPPPQTAFYRLHLTRP